jgi:CheY-like chemotaxis protein
MESAMCDLAHKSLRILVVEDNADSAESEAVLLRLWGHEVAIARDGASALAIVGPFDPHVVLLDLGLPDMSGFEVARTLRELERVPPLLVAVSGYGQERDLQQCYDAGFHRHFLKPVDPKRLKKLLDEVAQDVPAESAGREPAKRKATLVA